MPVACATSAFHILYPLQAKQNSRLQTKRNAIIAGAGGVRASGVRNERASNRIFYVMSVEGGGLGVRQGFAQSTGVRPGPGPESGPPCACDNLTACRFFSLFEYFMYKFVEEFAK